MNSKGDEERRQRVRDAYNLLPSSDGIDEADPRWSDGLLDVWQRALKDAYAVSSDGSLREKRGIRWPSEIVASRPCGGALRLTMTKKGVSARMEENHAAFEAWALASKELLDHTIGVGAIELAWAIPAESDLRDRKGRSTPKAHYERFLYRASLFQDLFGDEWFSIPSANCREAVSKCQVLSEDSLELNLATDQRPPRTWPATD